MDIQLQSCMSLHLFLLFLFVSSALSELLITLLEEHFSDNRQQKLQAVAQACSQGVVTNDSSVEGGENNSSEVLVD
jgi:hypothetical protein